MKEEKEIALKQKEDEEQRINEENRRIKEWEDKFDQEQKKREDELIRKFYSDRQIEPENIESNENSKSDTVSNDSEEDKSN